MKTKALISFADLRLCFRICKSLFSHDAAHLSVVQSRLVWPYLDILDLWLLWRALSASSQRRSVMSPRCRCLSLLHTHPWWSQTRQHCSGEFLIRLNTHWYNIVSFDFLLCIHGKQLVGTVSYSKYTSLGQVWPKRVTRAKCSSYH